MYQGSQGTLMKFLRLKGMSFGKYKNLSPSEKDEVNSEINSLVSKGLLAEAKIVVSMFDYDSGKYLPDIIVNGSNPEDVEAEYEDKYPDYGIQAYWKGDKKLNEASSQISQYVKQKKQKEEE